MHKFYIVISLVNIDKPAKNDYLTLWIVKKPLKFQERPAQSLKGET
jgi:hypothetical protein